MIIFGTFIQHKNWHFIFLSNYDIGKISTSAQTVEKFPCDKKRLHYISQLIIYFYNSNVHISETIIVQQQNNDGSIFDISGDLN